MLWFSNGLAFTPILQHGDKLWIQSHCILRDKSGTIIGRRFSTQADSCGFIAAPYSEWSAQINPHFPLSGSMNVAFGSKAEVGHLTTMRQFWARSCRGRLAVKLARPVAIEHMPAQRVTMRQIWMIKVVIRVVSHANTPHHGARSMIAGSSERYNFG